MEPLRFGDPRTGEIRPPAWPCGQESAEQPYPPFGEGYQNPTAGRDVLIRAYDEFVTEWNRALGGMIWQPFAWKTHC
jgi:hypothetical protein